MKPILVWMPGVILAVALTMSQAHAAESNQKAVDEAAARLGIQGISATRGEDDPRILFILPWQPPSLPRRPRAELDDHAPSLEKSLDPLVLENHLRFRETLDPLMLNPQGIQP